MGNDHFERLLQAACLLQVGGVISEEYFRGYHRGLRRLHHGERFSTEAENEEWLRMGLVDDERVDLGNGYRDGFAGRDLHQVVASLNEVIPVGW